MSWINVKSELPKKDQHVIVICDNPAFIAEALYDGSMWWRNNNGYGFTVSCDVSKWMSKPQISQDGNLDNSPASPVQQTKVTTCSNPTVPYGVCGFYHTPNRCSNNEAWQNKQ